MLVLIRFFLYFLSDCAVDLGIISTDDLLRMANGDIKESTDDEFAIKTMLEFMTLLTNMSSIRRDTADSTLKFLLTKTRKNNFDRSCNFRKRSRFHVKNEEGDGEGPISRKHKKIKTKVFDKTCSKANNFITTEVTVDKGFDLKDFFISDEGIVNLEGGLMFSWVC